MNKVFILPIVLLLIISCSDKKEIKQQNELETKMNEIAEGYVKLVLKAGQYDQDLVDAYYGPPEWRPAEKNLQLDSTRYSELNSISRGLGYNVLWWRKCQLGLRLFARESWRRSRLAKWSLKWQF